MKNKVKNAAQWVWDHKGTVIIAVLVVVNVCIGIAIVFNLNRTDGDLEPRHTIDQPVELGSEEPEGMQTLDANVEEFELDGTEMVVPGYEGGNNVTEQNTETVSETEQESIVME